LFVFLATALGAGLLGSAFTASSVREWYPTLAKPVWTPPSWLFGPVWTALYGAMAVVGWRLWRRRAEPDSAFALRAYWTQLALNAAWSPVFFGLQAPGGALGVIVPLWATIAWLQARLLRLDPVGAVLWAPYLAWVSFATALNAAIWWLNR
jgi:benzodiazapine receptor